MTTRSTVAVTATGFALIGLGTAPPAILGYLGALVRTDLHLSAAALGLVASLFYGVTGVGFVVAGRCCDRIGADRAAASAAALVAVSTIVLALWPGYGVLLVTAVLTGTAYAITNVATNVAVSVVAPARSIGFLLGVKTAGVPAVATLVGSTGPWVARGIGWNGLAGVVGGLTAVAAVVAWRVLPDSGRVVGAETGPPLPRTFPLLALAPFLTIAGSQPLLSWSAIYLHDVLGVSVSAAGSLAALASLTSIGALLFVSSYADRLGAHRRSTVVAVSSTVCAGGVALVAGGQTVGLGLVVVGIVVGIWTNLVSAGMTHALVVDRAPQRVGTASGIALSGYYLGALVAPAGFGYLVDATGGYTAGWLVAAGSLLLASVTYTVVGLVVPLVPHAAATDESVADVP